MTSGQRTFRVTPPSDLHVEPPLLAHFARERSTWPFGHQHSGIGHVTPSARHAGDEVARLAARRAVTSARRRHSEHWAGTERQWKRPLTVTLNPENRRSADSIAA